jgi:Domain of unknown function (DUF4395)
MKHSILPFGDTLTGYSVPVLNERAVRAAAGILFALALFAFMHAWLQANFGPTRLFIVGFLIEFSIRLFISPKYAPSLIVGQWLVRKQAPEYSGAAQKAFAWAIGFALSLLMFYLMVLNQYIGPLNLWVCGICLTLMWFETSAGICIGCKIYNAVAKDPAQLCPGNTCAYTPLPGAGGHWRHGLAVLLFGAVFFYGAKLALPEEDAHLLGAAATKAPASAVPAALTPPAPPTSPAPALTQAAQAKQDAETLRCAVPEFAKKIGHEAQWKKHNQCE